MARFNKGIHGAYTGKVGNIVGSSWRGIDYVRSLPKKSSKPASDKQTAQRMKFGMTTSFLKSIKDVLMLGYSDSKQRGKTGYNVAFQHFIDKAIVGNYPNFSIDYAAVKIASGSLAILMGLETVESAPSVSHWAGILRSISLMLFQTIRYSQSCMNRLRISFMPMKVQPETIVPWKLHCRQVIRARPWLAGHSQYIGMVSLHRVVSIWVNLC